MKAERSERITNQNRRRTSLYTRAYSSFRKDNRVYPSGSFFSIPGIITFLSREESSLPKLSGTESGFRPGQKQDYQESLLNMGLVFP
jgi:hypothetical protein